MLLDTRRKRVSIIVVKFNLETTMSMAATHEARNFAKAHTISEIRDEISRLEAMPRHEGIEFDDARVRHMHTTKIEILRSYVILREAAALIQATDL